MSLRSTADGQYLIRTTGTFVSGAPHTICFWLYLETDRNASSAAFGIRDSGSGAGYIYYYNANGDGTTFVWEHYGDFQLDPVDLSLNTWYFVALSRSGTGANQTVAYHRLATDTAFTSATGTFPQTPTYNEETVFANGYAVTSSSFRGRIAGLRQWGAALSADELWLESQQLTPVRTTNLASWYPMTGGTAADCAVDFGGNARNQTVTGSLVTSDNPPVPWRSTTPQTIIITAGGGTGVTPTPAAITGSFALQVPTVTATTSITSSPSAISGSLAVASPTISTTASVAVTPAAITGTFAVPSVTVQEGGSIATTVSALTGTFSVPAVTVTLGTSVTATPAVIPGTFSTTSSTFLLDNNFSVSPVSGTFTVRNPSVSTGGAASFSNKLRNLAIHIGLRL